jgi:hypothetical protein
MGKKINIRIRDEHFGSYFRELKNNCVEILQFFDEDPEIFLTMDQG